MRAFIARRGRNSVGARFKSTRRISRWLLACLCLLSLAPAAAQETITYTYDARGRVVQVNHGTTGPNANVVASYTYDDADNRCNVTVSTTGGTGTGTCAAAPVTITLSPTTLPGGTVGTAYSKTITASGGTAPYTFTKSAGTLPAGLTLTSAGVLSGTPTTAATYSFTIKATDSAAHSGTQSYNVTIAATGVTITLSPTTLPNGTVGTAYSKTITASGGTAPYTFTKSVGTLPAGLTLSSGGVLSGTPTTAAAYSFTIKATDSAAHSGTQSYSVTIGSSSNPPIVANPDDGGTLFCGGDTEILDVVANDTGGVPPLSLVSATGNGIKVTVVSSTEVQINTLASTGPKSFSYVVQDTVGTQATGTGTVAVTSPCP